MAYLFRGKLYSKYLSLKGGMAALTVLLVARAMQATAIEEPNDWKIGRSKRKKWILFSPAEVEKPRLLKRIVIWVLRAQHVICCASFARGGDYEYQ